jgi:uncharacterized membrane-anchored protein YitT (DUF2179 family)
MTAKEFVSNFKKEKDYSLMLYTSDKEATAVSEIIKKMNLTKKQEILMYDVIEGILNNTFYSILLGLDGSTSIGDVQHTYKIYDEYGNLISDCGELEAEAWEPFNEK